jgi:ribonuclease HIII
MAQDTLVLPLGPAEGRHFEERLRAGEFAYRNVPHARVSVRGEGVVATLYLSGKLVVQGQEPGLFVERYLGVRAGERATAPERARPEEVEPRARVGCDETGKGDYFGPLVVCAVLLEPGQEEELRKAGVMDSKRLSDERVGRLAPALQGRYAYVVELLDPPEYNAAYARARNLNEVLADLHAKAIRRLAYPGCDVLVDQFADPGLLERRLQGLDIRLRQAPRAEVEMAVAAASVIARAVFLERLAALSSEHGVDLHKGAGEPVDKAVRRFVEIHGAGALPKVAKMHFKNTSRAR